LTCPHGILKSHCRPCLAEKARLFRKANPGYVPGSRMKYNGPVEAKAVLLLSSARNRAEVTIDRQWVLERLHAGVCEVTGVRFVIGERKWHPLGPSLDRKDPALGYTPENVQVVTWIYNRAKGNGTHEDVLALALALTGRTA
jgi:hypothetical protein